MRQWTVDAFTDQAFKGNPACVVEPLEDWPDDAWMQSLAAENNQAETAFLVRTEDPARFGLRWMTPKVEVALCGHATLASRHVLFEELGLCAQRVVFDTRSGPLVVAPTSAGYEMDFPAIRSRRIEVPEGLEDVLGAAPVEVWACDRLVVVLADEAAVRALTPDLAGVQALAKRYSDGHGDLGVTAAAAVGRPYDLVSRFFAPGSGVAEDAATGSYHCAAAPIFAEKLGRAVLRFHQAYPGRGGDVQAEVAGDRVKLRGRAVTVLESRLRIEDARRLAGDGRLEKRVSV